MKGNTKAYLWRMNHRDRGIEKIELSDEINPTSFAKIHQIFLNKRNKSKSANRFRPNKADKDGK
jgi:hypothetical protein